MINTNDGYFWASNLQNAVNGWHESNPRINDWSKYAIVLIPAFFIKFFGLDINSVILYLPIFMSSVVVIPIILIFKVYNQIQVGFLAAIIASITWSFYNRTMLGYFDTDMFSITIPMFILYYFIKSVEKKNINDILISSILISFYPYFYDQGHSLIFAMSLLFFIYTFINFRKEEFFFQLIIILCVSMLKIPLLIKISVILGIYFIFYKKILKTKYLVYLTILFFILFLGYSQIFDIIYSKLNVYLNRGVEQEGLKFFQVSQTIREAGKIPFETMANRISGSIIAFIFGIIGYILMIYKYRPMLLSLPLIGLGVFSYFAGLRFTIYAVPILSMGIVFFIYFLSSFINKKLLKSIFICFFIVFALYPNLKHILGYKIPTVFFKEEVKVLDELKQISNNKDFTISWWDYGYPIWYYSNTNTLIDGGKHNHDNFVISQILNTTSQIQAANLARLAIETYVSTNYKVVSDNIFSENPNIKLDELAFENYKLPTKTRDIYIYLPQRMMNIFQTVKLFSNIDLMTGEKGKKNFLYQTNNIKEVGNEIDLQNGISILKDQGKIKISNKVLGIKRFAITYYDKEGNLKTNIKNIDNNVGLNVIYMKNYNKFLVMDEETYKSLFIQLFVFENFDERLFEAVILSPYAKVYKIKI